MLETRGFTSQLQSLPEVTTFLPALSKEKGQGEDALMSGSQGNTSSMSEGMKGTER